MESILQSCDYEQKEPSKLKPEFENWKIIWITDKGEAGAFRKTRAKVVIQVVDSK